MTIAILATGDEIIHGDTVNTNANAIAHAMSANGLSLGFHLACSDLEQDIVSCLDFLSQEHQIIILIGGLGPTSDDRTRFAVARFLNEPLIEFADAIQHVEARLARAQLKMNAGNRQQAMFPEHAILFPNPNGTAYGCCISDVAHNKLFFLLPGPPNECLPMFENDVLPRLQKMQHATKQLLRWRLFGVAEGTIAHKLDNALAHLVCQTGYRLDTPYLEFKVRCEKEVVIEVQQVVEPLIAEYIIASPEQKASEKLREKIEQINLPIVILDDVTGGVIQTLLQRPNNYHKLKFYTDDTNPKGSPSKSSDALAPNAASSPLFFHLKGLQDFWAPPSGGHTQGKTRVTIDYTVAGQQGSDSHQIPYYSPTVIYYAAEWLSFRMLQLINQLHQ